MLRSTYPDRADQSQAYRELIRFSSGFVSSVSIVPDFGWLLVLISGSLIAYSLDELVPTHAPETWQAKTRGGGYDLSGHEQPTAFARVGVTKGRTMGKLKIPVGSWMELTPFKVVHAAYAKCVQPPQVCCSY